MNLDDILSERLAIVGGTGSGKSYTARGLVERMLANDGRVGVIDPTGVWYGLRTKADGKPGFPVVIFGGDRSDVPLLETAGRVVAQAVAATHQSWVIDTSALKSKAAERRFMLDFLDAIFMANHEDLTLVVDEADRFSPQRMNPESARLHERMEEIVRRGRVRGFTPWLITQRPASLNKDVLSQATAMISLRMTGAHDRKALADVIEGQADREDARRIIGAMPNHTTGHGLVWAPQQRILEAVHFPKIHTADTMRAPKPGERRADKPLPPIDLGKLKEQLAAVEIEAKANDPKALKAEVARLTRELAAKPRAEASPEALQAQHDAGYRRGRIEARAEIVALYRARIGEATSILSAPLPALGVEPSPAGRPAAGRAAPVPRAPLAPSGDGEANLPQSQRNILTVICQYGGSIEGNRLAAIAGYSPSGGGFRNVMSSLRVQGFIAPGPQPYRATDAGRAALGPYDELPTGAAALDMWAARLGPACGNLLRALSSAGGEAAALDLCQTLNYEISGGGWRNLVSGLRTRGLVSGPASGTLSLHEDLR